MLDKKDCAVYDPISIKFYKVQINLHNRKHINGYLETREDRDGRWEELQRYEKTLVGNGDIC
jgi:hypothetical protein